MLLRGLIVETSLTVAVRSYRPKSLSSLSASNWLYSKDVNNKEMNH